MTTTNRPENIKVLVRVRPLLQHESGPVAVVCQAGNEIRVNGGTNNKQLRCCYDGVIGPEVSQEGVFSHVRECTSAVLDGENSTVFAYGQTGSGKTYTMFGPEESIDGTGQENRKGVIPLAVTDLFTGLMGDGKQCDAADFSVWVSLVQLYNEQLYDMLRDPQRVRPLAIHEQPEAGIYVQGLSEYAVHSAGECLQLLRTGSEHRAIRETHMNQASSRSHSIFQIVVEQKWRSEQDGERILRSKFNLVDLAGSEKWDVKQEMEEIRVNEMTNINVSLYTLGRVIAALSTDSSKGGNSEHGRQPHVPYRDSKLTRLLQDSLGGNTRTRVIATLSPARECLDETINTLRFADRVKQVMAYVRVNEHRPVDHALVQRLQAEVKHLRRLLRDVAEKRKSREELGSDGRPPSSAVAALTAAQIIGYKQEIDQLRRENTALRVKILSPRASPEISCGQVSRTSEGTPDIAAVQASNKILEQSIAQMVTNLRRFFRFEIEEEDLQTELNRVLARTSGRIAGEICWDGSDQSTSPLCFSASPLGFPAAFRDKSRRRQCRHGLTPPSSARSNVSVTHHSPVRSGARSPMNTQSNDVRSNPVKQDKEASQTANGVALPSVPGGTEDHAPRSEKLAYRLRGKHPDDMVVVMREEVTEEDEERRLRKELKSAKERMKKNLQLQEWLLQKEQREVEDLKRESARKNKVERDRRRKDQEFRRRAAKQKAKLKRFYESAQAEMQKEAEINDHNFLCSLDKQNGASSLSHSETVREDSNGDIGESLSSKM